MNNKPLVSVIINTFNRCKILGRAITSVLNQTYTNLEIIVIDAHSDDGTKEVVASFQDARIIYYCSPTSDCATCLNTGFSMAKGEYVALLDDDDEWLPCKIEKQYSLLSGLDESYGWVGCGLEFWDDQKNISTRTFIPYSRGDVFLKQLFQIKVGTAASSAMFIRKRAIDDLGGFVTSVRFSTDYLFYLKLSTKYKFDFVPEVLYIYHNNHIYQQQRGSLMKFSREFLENKIEVEKYILNEYSDAFDQYPQYRFDYYNKLARMNAILRNKKDSLQYFSKAVFADPTQIQRSVRLLGSILYHIFIKNLLAE